MSMHRHVMKFTKHLLLVIGFTLAAIYFSTIAIALMNHGWEGGLWDSDGFLPFMNVFAALCAVLVGLAILFVIGYIVNKVYHRNNYD